MKLQHFAASLALSMTLVAGCHADESLNSPTLVGGDLFRRYVSMGNSIAAGFQSAGINDSTQHESFAVLVANAAGAPFFVPSLAGNGCPPPFTNNVTGTRVGGGTSDVECSLRETSVLPYVSNVAVPGAAIIDALNNFDPASDPNFLTNLILGGRTQIQAMQDAKPTFVSLELGANDVLGALLDANPGNPALVTSASDFQTRYTQTLDAIKATGAKAVLIGVPDVTVIPYASKGATYWCLKTGACGIPAAGFPATFTVNNNCAPFAAIPGAKGDSTLVPWPIGLTKIATAAAGASTTLDCSVDAEVVLPAEFAAMRDAVVAYNAAIQAEATTRGWAFVNLNGTLQALVATGAIPPFPNLTPALSGQSVTFGLYITLDGFHPSALAHRLLADSVASAINQTYGTNLPVPVP